MATARAEIRDRDVAQVQRSRTASNNSEGWQWGGLQWEKSDLPLPSKKDPALDWITQGYQLHSLLVVTRRGLHLESSCLWKQGTLWVRSLTLVLNLKGRPLWIQLRMIINGFAGTALSLPNTEVVGHRTHFSYCGTTGNGTWTLPEPPQAFPEAKT